VSRQNSNKNFNLKLQFNSICVLINHRKKINIRIAYNSQNDALIGLLTVEESLQYASQLRNFNSKKYDFFNDQQNNGLIDGNCSYNATNNDLDYNYFPDQNLETKFIEKKYSDRIYIQNMIKVFGLEQCANVRAFNCSGGQKKRLTIALELMFSPNILLLDEPTSGLDSVSSLQCVSLLKKLSKNKEPLIIAASVHQPSAKILTHFDNIYVLSVDGHCVYNGPTDALIDHLSSFGLICPLYHNPADFMLEIASGDHGKQVIYNFFFQNFSLFLNL
jgi:ABC-type multidrug transport system ATPase subunit